ncbi:MAG: VOC family protein [Caldilineaceae bacterium]
MSTATMEKISSMLDAATQMGAVQLTVSDLDRSIAFYETILGFQLHDRSGGQAHLGAGGPTLVELVELKGARHVTHHSGLYHFAILTPSRFALAQVLRNLVKHQVQIGGSDHLVSEAIYLSDPDGNGIEMYRDRPRHEWQYENGLPVLGGLPLDYQGILRIGRRSRAVDRTGRSYGNGSHAPARQQFAGGGRFLSPSRGL